MLVRTSETGSQSSMRVSNLRATKLESDCLRQRMFCKSSQFRYSRGRVVASEYSSAMIAPIAKMSTGEL